MFQSLEFSFSLLSVLFRDFYERFSFLSLFQRESGSLLCISFNILRGNLARQARIDLFAHARRLTVVFVIRNDAPFAFCLVLLFQHSMALVLVHLQPAPHFYMQRKSNYPLQTCKKFSDVWSKPCTRDIQQQITTILALPFMLHRLVY